MSDVSLTGDFAELDALRAKLASLAGTDVHARINRLFGEQARSLIQQGFENSTDPYGNRWDPVARGGQPLLDTGRLRNSFRVDSNASGFTVGTNVKYASTHQYGAVIQAKRPGKPLKFRIGRSGPWRSKYAVKIKKRQMVPEGTLPSIWMEAFNSIAGEFLAREFPGSE